MTVAPDRRMTLNEFLTYDDEYQFKMYLGEDSIVSPSFPTLNLTASQVLSAGR